MKYLNVTEVKNLHVLMDFLNERFAGDDDLSFDTSIVDANGDNLGSIVPSNGEYLFYPDQEKDD